MYNININVGNFAVGKLKQRVEFSEMIPYNHALGQGIRHTQYIN